MKQFALLLVGLLSSTPSFAAPVGVTPQDTATAEQTCDISQITGARELHDALSTRAVEVVQRATHSDWQGDSRLAELVAPEAAFSLGAGDVGRPLGKGTTGARSLAELMRADSYRFYGWDYMNGPASPCASQKVDVEFVNSRAMRSSQMEVTFSGGRVVAAKGWERSFQAGPVSAQLP